jgi:hypothetical protein
MLVEDTEDHREMFRRGGKGRRLSTIIGRMIEKARWLRERMMSANGLPNRYTSNHAENTPIATGYAACYFPQIA